MRKVRIPTKWSANRSFAPEMRKAARSNHSCTAGLTGASGIDLDIDDIEQLRAGEESALERILSRHRKALKSCAVHILHSGVAADEVVQEAVERMFAALNRFDSRRPLAAWLNRIVVNLCLDRLRVARRQRRFVSLDDPEQNLTCMEDPSRPPDQALISGEEERWLCAALLRLPPKLRASMERFALAGQRQRSIANELHTSLKTVEMDLYHARSLLRRALCERERNSCNVQDSRRTVSCRRTDTKESPSSNLLGAAKSHEA